MVTNQNLTLSTHSHVIPNSHPIYSFFFFLWNRNSHLAECPGCLFPCIKTLFFPQNSKYTSHNSDLFCSPFFKIASYLAIVKCMFSHLRVAIFICPQDRFISQNSECLQIIILNLQILNSDFFPHNFECISHIVISSVTNKTSVIIYTYKPK